jgi:nicotinamidase-related amidase
MRACMLTAIVLSCAGYAMAAGEATGTLVLGGQAVMAQAQPRVIQVPWHIYRHYPADFSAGPASARGFIGWEAETRDLDLDKTALLLMHLPDAGLTPDSEWGPDCPRPDLLGTVEWVPRTVDMIRNRLPKLVEAARAAGLQVVHVHTRAEYQTGPCWERSVAEAGDPPPEEIDKIDDEGLLAAHKKDVFQLAARPEGSPEHTWGMPEVLMPQGDDLIAGETWRLHRLMKARGINHLIYCGWALNWCLWFSSGGMCDMNRHGYLCSAVRGGCVAIENKASADTEANLEYACWKTSTMFGYVFELDELAEALRKAAG